jgi:hypothetical protein
MGVCRTLVVAAALAIGVSSLTLAAQQAPTPAAAPATPLTPTQIKQELEKIKKGRTLGIGPAEGVEDAEGATALFLDNPSPFNLIVLLVGPTTARVELGPARMQTLAVEPGVYEIAVTVVGRDLPPFYGTQTIVKNMRFRHQFIVPNF